MTRLEHDGAQSLKVEYQRARFAPGRGHTAGWYVVRTCPCHRGELITMPLDSRERAEHALAVLDEDARIRG